MGPGGKCPSGRERFNPDLVAAVRGYAKEEDDSGELSFLPFDKEKPYFQAEASAAIPQKFGSKQLPYLSNKAD